MAAIILVPLCIKECGLRFYDLLLVQYKLFLIVIVKTLLICVKLIIAFHLYYQYTHDTSIIPYPWSTEDSISYCYKICFQYSYMSVVADSHRLASYTLFYKNCLIDAHTCDSIPLSN